MATITYDARDVAQLKSGHSAGTQYAIAVDLAEFEEVPDAVEVSNTTLAGVVYTDLYRTQTEYSIVTDLVPESGANSLEDLREFVYSCLGGYGFAINHAGVDYALIFRPGRAPRIQRRGPLLYQVAFTARVVA